MAVRPIMTPRRQAKVELQLLLGLRLAAPTGPDINPTTASGTIRRSNRKPFQQLTRHMHQQSGGRAEQDPAAYTSGSVNSPFNWSRKREQNRQGELITPSCARNAIERWWFSISTLYY